MVAAGPASHEEVALKLNTTLPVTSQEEKCNGMLKNYIFDHQALTKINLLYLQHKRLYALYTYFHRRNNCQLLVGLTSGMECND